MDVVEQGARGVGRVGGVQGAAGELPQEPAVDGAERQLARPGAPAGIGHVVQQPGKLGAGQVGVEHEAGLARDQLAVAGGAQAVAQAGGAAVLPDDGAVDGLAGAAIPHHGGFALVGEAHGGDVGCSKACVCHDLARNRALAGPDVLRVVFHPARLGKMLCEFALRDAVDAAGGVEQQGTRAGGALVEREYVGHGGSPVRQDECSTADQNLTKRTGDSRVGLLSSCLPCG